MELEVEENVIRTIIGVYEQMMVRYRNIEDPATKFTLLVDRLCLGVDMALATFESLRKSLSPETFQKMENVKKDVQTELNNLINWIQSPTYSPDHPYGNATMKKSEVSFNKKL